VAKIGT